MNPDELREILEAAGREPVPPPRADFVDDLERRLGRTHVAAGRAHRSHRPALAALAAAAAVIVAVLVLQPDEPQDTVVTDTSTSTSSSVTTSTSTSTTGVPPTTVTTAASTTTALPPTTAPPPPPTTTTTPPTTTTTASGVEDLRIACRTGPRPEVTCTWSASTAEQFKGYVLSKRVGDGELQELGRTTDRSFTTKTDKDVEPGTRITYVIEAIDRESTVIGRGEATVSCC